MRTFALVADEVELNRKAENPLFLGWTEGRDRRNERDYKAMVHAARQGRIEVHIES